MSHKLKLLVLFLIMGTYAMAQQLTVTGMVTDDQGLPLPGVSIVIQGTTTGTITDFNGNYSIKVDKGQQVVFSFIGFANQTFTIEGSILNVKMKTDSEIVDEVVVVGYGQQKKESVVGAIGTAKAEKLKEQGNITNLSDALEGAIPGLMVSVGTGRPGGGEGDEYKETEILIRGKSSWNSNAPLILVDGIERDMNDVEINEVESISVLKDASATAVFGVKGANGVILVTTKRGDEGKAKLSFEGSISMESVSKMPEVMDSYTGILARNRAIINEVAANPTAWSSLVPDEELEHYRLGDLPYAYTNTNWSDELMKNYATSYKFNMNASGGSKRVKYFTSLGFTHTGDILSTENVGQGYSPEFSYDRYNFRNNLDFSLTKTTKFSANIGGYYGRQQSSGGSVHDIWYGVYNHAPDGTPIQYEDGVYGANNETYERWGNNEFVNLNFNGVNVLNRTQINTDFTLEQKLDFITDGLKIDAKLGYDNFMQTSGPDINDTRPITKRVDPIFYLDGGYYDFEAGAYKYANGELADMSLYTQWYIPSESVKDNFEYTEPPLEYETEQFRSTDSGKTKRNLFYQARLNYARKFGSHDVSAMALFSREHRTTGNDLPDKREDWVGRMTYNFDNRYMAEVNGAYNGSQKFGPGYKFDFFPSMALGWTISNEDFFNKNISFIDLLKVRASVGKIGSDAIEGLQFAYLTQWLTGSVYSGGQADIYLDYDNDANNLYTAYKEGTMGNPLLQWETAIKRNIGIELAALKNKVKYTIDVFNEDREDILMSPEDMQKVSSPTLGQKPGATNLGKTKSHGVEMELTLRNTHENGVSYWASGNWSMVRNEVVNQEDPQLKPDYQKKEGYSIDQVTSQQAQGIINSWDDMYTGVMWMSNNQNYLPGDYRIIDFNSDGVIDGDDAAPYGFTTYPQNNYGFSFGASYKGFSFSMQFTGVYNTTIGTSNLGTFSKTSPIVYEWFLNDTWTPEYGNSNPTLGSLNFSRTGIPMASYQNMDGSLLRLKSAEISYSLPKEWLEPMKISMLKFYVNGNNLAVWTDLPVDVQGRNFNLKNYPIKKQVTFGLNVQF